MGSAGKFCVGASQNPENHQFWAYKSGTVAAKIKLKSYYYNFTSLKVTQLTLYKIKNKSGGGGVIKASARGIPKPGNSLILP